MIENPDHLDPSVREQSRLGSLASKSGGFFSWTSNQVTGFAKGILGGTQDLAAQGVALTQQATEAVADRIINRFADNTLYPTLKKNQEYLTQLTGSDELSKLLLALAKDNGPAILQQVESAILKHLLERHRKIALDTIELNIFAAVINLVEKAKNHAQKTGTPFPAQIEPADLLVKVLASIAETEEQKIKEFSEKLAAIEKSNATDASKKSAKQELFTHISDKLVEIAFPQGAEGLILPDVPYFHRARIAVFKKIKESIPSSIGDTCWKLWSFASADLQTNLKFLKTRPNGAATVEELQKCVNQSSVFLEESLKKIGGVPLLEQPTEAGFTYTIHEMIAKQLPSPMVGNWFDTALQGMGNEAAVKNLLGQFNQVSFPLVIHILTHLVQAADKEGIDPKKTVLSAAAETLARTLVKFPTAAKTEAGFAPLVDELLLKLGLDAASLATILPVDEEKIATSFFSEKTLAAIPALEAKNKVSYVLKKYLTDLALDFYTEVVEKRSPLIHPDPRLIGYEKGRAAVRQMLMETREDFKKDAQDLKKCAGFQEEIVKLLNKKLQIDTLSSSKDWLATTIKELTELPAIGQTEAFAEEYAIDVACDFCANLALTYPAAQKLAEVDMFPAATAHLSYLAKEKIRDFPRKMATLRALPEGNIKEKARKEKEKRELFGPFIAELIEKSGWNDDKNMRLPKAWKESARKQLLDSLLPDLTYQILDKWTQTLATNEAVLRANADDGGPAIQAVKVLGDHAIFLPSLPENVNYAALTHILAHLAKNEPKQALITMALNNLLKSIFTFSDLNRDELARTFPLRTKAPDDPFRLLFKPLALELLKKSGLDSNGLDEILLVGGAGLAKKIEDELVDFCMDFYERMIAPHPRSQGLASQVKGYQEGSHFLQGLVDELIPRARKSISDERKLLQESITDTLQDYYLETVKLPHNRAWLTEPFQELMNPASSPYVLQVEQFAEQFIGDALVDLFANLAITCPKEIRNSVDPKADMATSSLAHLLFIVENEVKDPQLVTKLRDWMDLPELTEAQKHAKAHAKIVLRDQLFGSAALQAMEKGGWDNRENIPAPKILQPAFKKLMAKVVLPDQLFHICCDMVVPKKFTPVDMRRLEKMGGTKQLDILCDGLAEIFTPKILAPLKTHSGPIAASLNEKVLHNSLSANEESWLGCKLDQLFDLSCADRKPLKRFGQLYVSNLLKTGLTQIGLHYKGAAQGDLANNIALYMRDLLKNSVFDPRLAEMIRIYCEQIAPLREFDKKISELRNQITKEYGEGAIKKETQDALQKLKLERVAKEQELQDKFAIRTTYNTLLKEFEPFAKQLLTDMGYFSHRDPPLSSFQDLPVPYFCKESLGSSLISSLLPGFCMATAEQMINAFDGLMPENKEVADYEQKLKERYEKNLVAGEKLPEGAKAPFVTAIHKLAAFLVKSIESKASLQGTDAALKVLDEMIIPQFYRGEKAKEAAIYVLDQNREKIGQKLGEESPHLIAIIKERLGEDLKTMIAAPLLKAAYNFIDNLEKIEQKTPELLFEFMFNVVPLVTDHFKLALQIAEKDGKAHIHEVNPLFMLREFDAAKKLHPAMPGYEEMRQLQEMEHYIKQLESRIKPFKGPGNNEHWYLEVDKLKNLKNGSPQAKEFLKYGPEYYLKEAKENYSAIQKAVNKKMQENFYEEFSQSLMRIAGLNGPQDIPGGEAFWSLLGVTEGEGWRELNKTIPGLLMEGLRSAFAPEQLNGHMANVLKALNRNLKKRRAQGEVELIPKNVVVDPKIKAMQQRCSEMFDQLKKILPKSMITELTEIPLLDEIPGKALAEALRDAFKECPLSKIIELGLLQAVENLPEKLPTNFEEFLLDKRKLAEENMRKIQIIHREGEKVLPLLFHKMEQNFFTWWEKTQEALDRWILQNLGPGGLQAKSFFDKIFHIVFISLVMGYTYRVARWMLFFVIETYSKLKSRKNIELGRASLVETGINVNLLFNIGDQFKKIYI